VTTYNSSWKIDIRLDERNDLSSTFGRSDHKHILCITQNSVVEKDTKKHQSQRDELLALIGWWNDRLDLRGRNTKDYDEIHSINISQNHIEKHQ